MLEHSLHKFPRLCLLSISWCLQGGAGQISTANRAGAAAHLPGCAGEREIGSGPALPVGDRRASLMCGCRGLSCAPQFVGCIHLILVGGSLHHSVLRGGVCRDFPAGSCLASAGQRGHMPGPFPPAPATGGESHPVPASSHAASRGTLRRLTLQKSKQRGKVSINIYFLQSIILPLPAFSLLLHQAIKSPP